MLRMQVDPFQLPLDRRTSLPSPDLLMSLESPCDQRINSHRSAHACQTRVSPVTSYGQGRALDPVAAGPSTNTATAVPSPTATIDPPLYVAVPKDSKSIYAVRPTRKGLYFGLLREHPVPESIAQAWNTQYKECLLNDLEGPRRKYAIEVELVMAGILSQDSDMIVLYPTIVIRCGSRNCKKAVSEAIDSLGWPDRFNSRRVFCKVGLAEPAASSKRKADSIVEESHPSDSLYRPIDVPTSSTLQGHSDKDILPSLGLLPGDVNSVWRDRRRVWRLPSNDTGSSASGFIERSSEQSVVSGSTAATWYSHEEATCFPPFSDGDGAAFRSANATGLPTSLLSEEYWAWNQDPYPGSAPDNVDPQLPNSVDYPLYMDGLGLGFEDLELPIISHDHLDMPSGIRLADVRSPYEVDLGSNRNGHLPLEVDSSDLLLPAAGWGIRQKTDRKFEGVTDHDSTQREGLTAESHEPMVNNKAVVRASRALKGTISLSGRLPTWDARGCLFRPLELTITDADLTRRSGVGVSSCILGGTIEINSRLYGLTAAHTLLFHTELDNDAASEATASDSGSETSVSGHLASTVVQRDSTSPRASRQRSALLNPLYLNFGGPAVYGRWNSADDDDHEEFDDVHSDFAVLELLPWYRTDRPNNYRHPDSREEMYVATMLETLPHNDTEAIVVLPHSIPLKSWLLSTPSSCTLHGTQLVTYKIQLPHPLERGCSGAWVVKDGSLLGHIVAVYADEPYAHMLPIGNIMEGLRSAFSKDTVIRLPQG